MFVCFFGMTILFFVFYSVYYRKYVNYQLDWNVDIAKNLVAIAPYGGLIGKNN